MRQWQNWILKENMQKICRDCGVSAFWMMIFKEDAKGVEAMCRAMEDMRKEAAAEQNILTLLETLRNLMKNLGWTAEQAMTAMGVSDSEKSILMKRI